MCLRLPLSRWHLVVSAIALALLVFGFCLGKWFSRTDSVGKYPEELVYARASDDIVNGGAYFIPPKESAKPVAVIWVHGWVDVHQVGQRGEASEVNAICGDCFANPAIRSCLVDTVVEFRCIRRVSQEGSVIRRLASLPWLRPGAVRQLRRYYQGAMTSCRPSRRASLPSLGGTSSVHSFCSLPGGRVRRRGLELVTR